jgi:hypothetical protein
MIKLRSFLGFEAIAFIMLAVVTGFALSRKRLRQSEISSRDASSTKAISQKFEFDRPYGWLLYARS